MNRKKKKHGKRICDVSYPFVLFDTLTIVSSPLPWSTPLWHTVEQRGCHTKTVFGSPFAGTGTLSRC